VVWTAVDGSARAAPRRADLAVGSVGIPVALSPGMTQLRTLSLYSATALAAAALAASALAGCDWNSIETGSNDIVQFIPDECGNVGGCDLSAGLVAGGTTLIELDAVDIDDDVSGLHLESSDPWVADVIAEEYDPFRPAFRIEGFESGWVDLLAVDDWGNAIDWITIEVAEADGIYLEHREGAALGPDAFAAAGFDEVWSINADEIVELAMLATDGPFELMGEIDYYVEVDAVLAAGMTSDADLARGLLRFRVPAGDYGIRYVAPNGIVRDIMFSAR
jgi:hypothetical protein